MLRKDVMALKRYSRFLYSERADQMRLVRGLDFARCKNAGFSWKRKRRRPCVRGTLRIATWPKLRLGRCLDAGAAGSCRFGSRSTPQIFQTLEENRNRNSCAKLLTPNLNRRPATVPGETSLEKFSQQEACPERRFALCAAIFPEALRRMRLQVFPRPWCACCSGYARRV